MQSCFSHSILVIAEDQTGTRETGLDQYGISSYRLLYVQKVTVLNKLYQQFLFQFLELLNGDNSKKKSLFKKEQKTVPVVTRMFFSTPHREFPYQAGLWEASEISSHHTYEAPALHSSIYTSGSQLCLTSVQSEHRAWKSCSAGLWKSIAIRLNLYHFFHNFREDPLSHQ